MKNQGGFFFCVCVCVCSSLRVYFTNLVGKHVSSVSQPFYTTSGVARFSFRPPTEIMSFFALFYL